MFLLKNAKVTQNAFQKTELSGSKLVPGNETKISTNFVKNINSRFTIQKKMFLGSFVKTETKGNSKKTQSLSSKMWLLVNFRGQED